MLYHGTIGRCQPCQDRYHIVAFIDLFTGSVSIETLHVVKGQWMSSMAVLCMHEDTQSIYSLLNVTVVDVMDEKIVLCHQYQQFCQKKGRQLHHLSLVCTACCGGQLFLPVISAQK